MTAFPENPVTLLAATTPQRIGLAIVLVFIVGWAGYLLLYVRRTTDDVGSEMELAPNRRPYLDDEGMEGSRLTSVLWFAFALLVIIAIGYPVYWAREPGRQDGAVRGFDNRAAGRGLILFQPAGSSIPEGNVGHFGCGGCHGSEGQGGVTQYAITDYLGRSRFVKWQAPALNDVLLRYSDEEVRTIIEYGRANTPMPAWGLKGGGPMNDQQIGDLISYLKRIQLTPEQAKQQAAKYGTDGKALFEAYCARCHTKGWSYGEPSEAGGGAFGFNLTNGLTVRQFPNVTDHEDFVNVGSDFAKAYGDRGVGTGRMPGFGRMLTADQIRAIVEYERSL